MRLITTLNKAFRKIDAAAGQRVSMSEISRTTGVSIVTLSRIKNNKVGYTERIRCSVSSRYIRPLILVISLSVRKLLSPAWASNHRENLCESSVGPYPTHARGWQKG